MYKVYHAPTGHSLAAALDRDLMTMAPAWPSFNVRENFNNVFFLAAVLSTLLSSNPLAALSACCKQRKIT